MTRSAGRPATVSWATANVLDVLRGGIDSALRGLGESSISELDPSDVIVPPGFTRELGASVDAPA